MVLFFGLVFFVALPPPLEIFLPTPLLEPSNQSHLDQLTHHFTIIFKIFVPTFLYYICRSSALSTLLLLNIFITSVLLPPSISTFAVKNLSACMGFRRAVSRFLISQKVFPGPIIWSLLLHSANIFFLIALLFSNSSRRRARS